MSIVRNSSESGRGIWLPRISAYKVAVVIGFVVASALALATPVQMPDPDDWAYYYAVRNFSQGHFTIDNQTQYLQATETGRQGNVLLQYLPIAFNKWALEKAPGYVFYLIPFQKIHAPRLGNIVLALGMVVVAFILLRRLRDEKTAMVGCLLLLFTPISLVMLNRAYMETYASLAFLVIGCGLYLYCHLNRANLSRRRRGVVLFLAFFFTGWSVITRYTNLPVGAILGLHFIINQVAGWRSKGTPEIRGAIVPVLAGTALPLLAILLYDYYVFGSPLTYGYNLSPFPTKFAFQYLGQVDSHGESIPAQILRYNSQGFARNILIGFPLFVILLAGLAGILGRQLLLRLRYCSPATKPDGSRIGMPTDILVFLIGWFVCVFGLYLTYEWTAGLQKGGGFVLFNRFLLPGLFPMAVVCASLASRLPYRFLAPLLTAAIVFGIVLYLQWGLNLHVLPDWLTLRTVESRWPGYIFPPWVEYPPADSGGMYFPWHILPQGAGPFPPR